MSQTSDEQREKQKAVEAAANNTAKSQKSGCLIGGIVFVVLAGILGSTAAESQELAVAIFIIAVIVGVVVSISNKSNKETAVANAASQIEKIQEIRRKNIDSMIKSAQNNSFVFSKSVMNQTNTSCLAIDTEHKTMLIKAETPGADYRIIPYSNLVSYELIKDGNSVVSGNVGEALVGGLLLGTVGAIAGASASKTVDDYCSSMYINIVDSLANRYIIPLLSEKVATTSFDYKTAFERAKEMLSILDVVSKEASNEVSKNFNAILSNNDSNVDDKNFEAIKKYKELFDMGIITREEFENKKTELL